MNAAARPGGSIRVGLLDADGQPIPGRGVGECRPLTSDHEARTVSWTDEANGDDVSGFSKQTIRLRIEMQDADLFGFQFQARP